MTIEERLARIEHVSAGSDEQRRKDRETDRALWRETQNQIHELTIRVAQVNDNLGARIGQIGTRIDQLAEESRAADRRLGERIEETDKRLGERIETMISAMGAYIRQHPPA